MIFYCWVFSHVAKLNDHWFDQLWCLHSCNHWVLLGHVMAERRCYSACLLLHSNELMPPWMSFCFVYPRLETTNRLQSGRQRCSRQEFLWGADRWKLIAAMKYTFSLWQQNPKTLRREAHKKFKTINFCLIWNFELVLPHQPPPLMGNNYRKTPHFDL